MSLSRFSLSSPFTLFQSIVAHDQDATSSSTSSSSAINNSSTSLSLSPAASSQSASIFGDVQQPQSQQQQQQQQQSQHRQQNQQKAFKFLTSETLTTVSTTKQISKHLLELQREIKEEEDEIFADINSLINDRSNLYSPFDEDDDFEENGAYIGGYSSVNTSNTLASTITQPPVSTSLSTARQPHQYRTLTPSPPPITSTSLIHQSQSSSHHRQTLPPDATTTTTITNTAPSHSLHDTLLLIEQNNNNNRSDDADDDHDIQEDDQNQEIEQEQIQIDVENDEEHMHHGHNHHNHEQSFQEAILQQQRDIQEITSNLPKPCVFFLEGNCRRSDCKFSHDLSSIICKYWIEGFCFKGEMCPFSHSLTPICNADSSMLGDENRSHLSEKALNPTFVIESEADFPSLPLDAPASLNSLIGDGGGVGGIQLKVSKQGALTKTIKNQILSSNPTVVFKTTKKKRKKG